MGNFFKMLVMLVGGAIVLTIFAGIFFAAAFMAMDAMGGNAGMSDAAAYSLGQKVGVTASIAGLCAGLVIAMGIASEKLETDSGKSPIIVLVIGWVLTAVIVGVFLYANLGTAFDTVMQYKTLGIGSVLIYGAIVGWAVRKITGSR